MLRKFLRAPVRTTLRSTVPEYRPDIHEQKLRNWTNRLNTLATSPASRMYVSQLAALMNYYNKVVEDRTKPINWADWKQRIITNGLVDKVKDNFQELNTQEYDLEKIFNEIFTKDSKALDDINNEMAFHTAIWLDNYSDFVSFLSNLEAISNPLDYTSLQFMDFFPTYQVQGDQLSETHNYYPGSKSDVNLFMYMSSQFEWGKKMITFYRHPADDFKGGRATKNTMGR